MKSRCFLSLIGCLMVSHAWAFDFTPAEFGRSFNIEARKQKSKVTAELFRCYVNPVQECIYRIGTIVLYVRGIGSAKIVEVRSSRENAGLYLSEIESVIATICSPLADKIKVRKYLFALQSSYDNDEVDYPRVRIIIEGIRYLRQRSMRTNNEIFQVSDNGYWRDGVLNDTDQDGIFYVDPPVKRQLDKALKPHIFY